MPYIQLTGKQQLAFRDLLVTLVVDEDKFEELLLELDIAIATICSGKDKLPTCILAAVKKALAEGWLLDLLAEARKRYTDPQLQAFEAELKASMRAVHVADPYQVCRLSGGHILIDRKNLREALGELGRPGGKRILVVQDERAVATSDTRIKTGKSHSLQMIAYLRDVTDGFDVVRIDLEAESRAVGSGKLIQPLDLAKSITSLMGCKQILQSMPAPSDGQWSRWNLEFCNDLEGAVKSAKQTWIVIDSFHLVLLPAETIDLLKELAIRINATLSNLRLVLLGYSNSLPAPVQPTVVDETVLRIGEMELIDFFSRADLEMARPLDADKVAQKVQAVLDGLDPAQPDFVVKLSSAAVVELNKP